MSTVCLKQTVTKKNQYFGDFVLLRTVKTTNKHKNRTTGRNPHCQDVKQVMWSLSFQPLVCFLSMIRKKDNSRLSDNSTSAYSFHCQCCHFFSLFLYFIFCLFLHHTPLTIFALSDCCESVLTGCDISFYPITSIEFNDKNECLF